MLGLFILSLLGCVLDIGNNRKSPRVDTHHAPDSVADIQDGSGDTAVESDGYEIETRLGEPPERYGDI